MPSWMNVYSFYVNGSIGLGYTVGEGFSLASIGVGVLDATFHTPKWFSSLPNDHLANSNIYLGFGTVINIDVTNNSKCLIANNKKTNEKHVMDKNTLDNTPEGVLLNNLTGIFGNG